MKKIFLILALIVACGADAYSQYALYGWGYNGAGQLGDGTTIDKTTPVQIDMDRNWASVACGDAHTLAIKSDGTLWAWGSNSSGRLGVGGGLTFSNIPIQIGTDSNWVTVDCGPNYSVGIKRDGTLWAWGYNNDGQLGDGLDEERYVPFQIGTDTNWASISCGNRHTVALKRNGTLWAWGYNEYGQLGDRNIVNTYIPNQIGNNSNWVSVACGGYHTIAIKSNGTLWAWGYNNWGQLGNGTRQSSYAPCQIGAASNWVSVSGGGAHTIAINSSGTLWACGWNSDGQLGDGTRITRENLVQIGTASNWVSVSCDNSSNSVAIKGDGTLWAWGYNENGWIGEGTTITRINPIQIGAATNWVSAKVGGYHTIAFRGNEVSLNAPILNYPANYVTDQATDLSISWDGDENARNYRVQVSTANDFRTTLVNEVINDTSKELIRLFNSTQYFWRVQAINGEQTSPWSEVRSFTTDSLSPTISTSTISVITHNSAVCNGSIINLEEVNYTAHGICWNTIGSPTINDNHTVNGASSNQTITFQSNLTNLTPNTVYFVRCYAVNATDTIYGEEISFTTDSPELYNPATWYTKITGAVKSLVTLGSNLFAVTESGMIYKSSDNGINWIQVNIGVDHISVNCLVAKGADLYAGTGDIIYTATFGGLYKSSDNGVTWIKIPVGNTNSISYLSVHDNNLYTGAGSTIYKSTNNGSSWTQINAGIQDRYFNNLVFAGNSLYALTTNDGVFKSTDEGANWTTFNEGLPNTWIESFVATDSNLYAVNMGDGLFKRTENDSSWVAINQILPNSYIRTLAANGNKLYAITYDNIGGKVYISTDEANSWTSILTANVQNLTTSRNCIFASSWSGEGLISNDNGATWNQVNNSGLPGSYIYCLLSQDNNMFAGTSGEGLFKSSNNGDTWEHVDGLNYSSVKSMVANNGIIFVGSENVIYRSIDSGVTWTTANQGLTQYYTLVEHLISNGNYLYGAGNKGVYKSSDNGMTWQYANNGLSSIDVRSIAVKNNILFVGTGTGVYKSTDNALSWTQSGLTVPWIQSISVANDDLYACNYSTVYKSSDNGNSWIQDTNGLPTQYPYPSLRTIVTKDSIIYLRGDIGLFKKSTNDTIWMPENNTGAANYVLSMSFKENDLFAGGVSRKAIINNDFGEVNINTNSEPQRFFINGSGLQNDVIINAPTGFMVSLSNNTDFAQSITLPPTNKIVPITNIYVRFSPSLVQNYTGSITISSLGAITRNIPVWGIGLESSIARPILTSPADSATNQAISSTLTWEAVPNVETYNLQVSTAQDFSTTIINQTRITETSFQADSLGFGTRYYWRVKSINATSESPWSEVRSFTTQLGYIDLETGLVAYYPFNGNANDESGNGNNGIMNNVQLSYDRNGIQNRALNFSEASSLVSTTLNMFPPQIFTISVWFKTTSTDGKILGFEDTQGGVSSNHDRHLFLNNNGLLNFGVWNGRTDIITSQSPVNDNEWHHAVVILSNNGLKLYCDGDLVGQNISVTTAQDSYNGYWRIGKGSAHPAWPFLSNSMIGYLDDVRFYNRELSIEEILSLTTNDTPQQAWELSYTSYDFGSVSLDDSAQTQLVIRNTGNIELGISSLAFNSELFEFSGVSLPYVLPVGDSITINVSYTPQAVGQASGRLSCIINGTTQNVSFIGTGATQVQPPILTYSASEPYNGLGVNPSNASAGQYFEFRVIYTDEGNFAPIQGSPKVQIDINADGILNEAWQSMAELDPSDADFTDGKIYVYHTQLSNTDTLKYRFSAKNHQGVDAVGAATNTLNGPIVTAPSVDLKIFANDIQFSKNNPNLFEAVTISATVHNGSNFNASNVSVRLYKEDIFLQEFILQNLPQNASQTVSLTHSFDTPDFYPIKVVVDELNQIAETNELNNFAIRPIVAGDFAIPGDIQASAFVSPGFVCNYGTINYSGHVDYVYANDPNTNVTGAEVLMTIQETGQTFTSHTDINGNYSIYFPAPGYGTYTLIAYITDNTLSTETSQVSFTVGNCNTTTTTETVILPDIRAGISAPSACYFINDSINATASITNVGNAGADNVLTKIYSDNQLILTRSYLRLEPGQTETIDLQFNTSSVGSHTLSVVVDPINEIVEQEEYYNTANYSAFVNPHQSDLTVWKIDMPPAAPIEGFPTDFVFTLKNLLCESSGITTANIYDIYNDNSTLIRTQQIPQIAGNGLYSFSLNDYEFEGTGYHTIKIIINSTTNEWDTQNNENSITLNVYPALPEIAVGRINCSDNNLTQGSTVTLSTYVSNFGYSNADEFLVRFYIDEQAIGTPIVVNNLGVGEEQIIQTQWTVNQCPKLFKVIADEDNEIEEYYNYNTMYTSARDFSPIVVNDAHINALVGSTLDLGAYIRNSGILSATNVPVAYKINGILDTVDILPFINRNSSIKSHIQKLFNTVGTYIVEVSANTDVDNMRPYCESNYGNNIANIYVNIYENLPDLEVLSEEIEPTELNPDTNETVNIFASFRNKGLVPTGPFYVKFLINSIQHGELVYIENISANGNSTVQATLPWASPIVGTHIVRVELDPQNTVTEISKMNNEASRAIIVGDAPDLTFSASLNKLLMSNEQPQIGDNISISSIIKNRGGAVGSGLLSYYLIQGSDTILIKSTNINVPDRDSITYSFDWIVSSTYGKILAKISDVEPTDFNLFNNKADKAFGTVPLALSINPTASPSVILSGQSSVLRANASGGTGNYSYRWEANSTGYISNSSTITVNPEISMNYTLYVEDGLTSVSQNITVTVEHVHLVSPANAANYQSINTTLLWQPLSSALTYNLKVSTTQDFATTILNENGITDTSFQTSGLSNSTQYFWKVQAINGEQTSEWSEVRSFTTIEAFLSVPVLTAPANLATNVLINPTLSWETAANATSYRIKVSTTNDFTTIIVNEVLTTTSKALSGLTNSTQYFWKVQTIRDEFSSEWSEVRSFTTMKFIPPTSAELNITALLTGLWSNNTHKAAAVMVELRSGNVLSSSTLHKRVAGLISETGEVSVLMNEITNGDYWLIVRSTGYLPIASAAKVSIQGGTIMNYDFTRSTASVFNANMLKAVNGRYLMKVGDLNSDRSISGADMSVVKANSGGSSTIPGL